MNWSALRRTSVRPGITGARNSGQATRQRSWSWSARATRWRSRSHSKTWPVPTSTSMIGWLRQPRTLSRSRPPRCVWRLHPRATSRRCGCEASSSGQLISPSATRICWPRKHPPTKKSFAGNSCLPPAWAVWWCPPACWVSFLPRCSKSYIPERRAVLRGCQPGCGYHRFGPAPSGAPMFGSGWRAGPMSRPLLIPWQGWPGSRRQAMPCALRSTGMPRTRCCRRPCLPMAGRAGRAFGGPRAARQRCYTVTAIRLRSRRRFAP